MVWGRSMVEGSPLRADESHLLAKAGDRENEHRSKTPRAMRLHDEY